MREIEVGKTYRHFKGMLVKVIALAKHSESLEDMVVYVHEDDGQVWVRPLEMFNSKVDKEKYPDILEEYRFTLYD